MALAKIKLERIEDQSIGALMGKCVRSPFTGKTILNCGSFPDFTIVDLWTRDTCLRTLPECAHDQYFFKPFPLGYRTWIYHYLYRACTVLPDAEETAVIKYVLSHRCIDAPVNGGRWSAMLCYVPAGLGACLTGDMTVVLVVIMASLFVYVIATQANTPNAYRYDRIVTFPVRIALTGFLLLWFLSTGLSGDIGMTIGGLCAVVCTLLDLIIGDLAALFNYRFHCTYEVIKVLPNRTMICRRTGAADYEQAFGERGSVPQDVSGIGNWEKDMTLIADISGLLIELRPMEYEDWCGIQDECNRYNKHPTFLGLDIFNEECPCSDLVVTGAAEIAYLARKAREKNREATEDSALVVKEL